MTATAQNQKYALCIPLAESLSRSPVDGREDGRPWLFETLAYNLPREPERGRDFFIFFTCNPLKRLDSEKKMAIMHLTERTFYASIFGIGASSHVRIRPFKPRLHR
jgi:hypothetical protein